MMEAIKGAYSRYTSVCHSLFDAHHTHVWYGAMVCYWIVSVTLAAQSDLPDMWIWGIIALLWITYLLYSLGKRYSEAGSSRAAAAAGSHQSGRFIMADSPATLSVASPMDTRSYTTPHDAPVHPTILSTLRRLLVLLILDGYLFVICTAFFGLWSTACWFSLGRIGPGFASLITAVTSFLVLSLRLSVPKIKRLEEIPTHWTRIKGCGWKTGSCIFFVLTLTACLQAGSVALGYAYHPAPGQRFNINAGFNQSPQYVHIYCMGQGSPTVWFEHGWTGSSLDFYRVYTEVSKFTRTCAWDRPGYGWSDAGTLPRTSEHSMVEEMLAHEAAKDYIFQTSVSKGVVQPIVYVGHSMAGFHSRIFIHRNPGVVGSLVLCDPVNADTTNTIVGLFTTLPAKTTWEGYIMATGIPRVLSWSYNPLYSTVYQLPQEIQPAYFHNILRSDWVETGIHEWNYWGDNAQRCKEAGSLGNLPLYLIVANSSDALMPSDTVKVAQLSTASTIFFAPGALHQFVMNATYTPLITSVIQQAWSQLRSTNGTTYYD